MPSKPLQRLAKLSKDVHAFVETNAATLANDASKIIAKGAPSATKIPALGTLLLQLSDAVQRSITAATAADRRLDDESADVPPEIEKRDALVSELREKVVRFRAVIETGYGAAVVRKLGFVGSTPQDPDQLIETTRAVLDSLKSVALGPAIDGVTVDTSKLTRGIATANEALAAASAQVRKEGREVQAARVLRDAEQREAERQVRGLAMVLEGLCVLAGQDALAERVRPATRQSAVDNQPDEPEPAPAT